MTKTPKPPFSRTRLKGGLSAAKPWNEVWSKTGAVVASGTGTQVGVSVVMIDRVTPGFEKLSSEGGVIMSPMMSVRREVSDETTGVQSTVINTGSSAYGSTYTDGAGIFPWVLKQRLTMLSGACPRTWSGDEILPNRLAALPLENIIAEACTKAHRIPTSANLLVSAAEFRQVLGLCPDLLHSWTKFFSRINAQRTRTTNVLPSGRTQTVGGEAPVRFLRNEFNDLTRFWLINRFGVRPLIADTLGVLQALRKVHDEHNRFTSRGVSTAQRSNVSTGVMRLGIADWSVTTSDHNEIRVRAMELFEGRLTTLEDMGLGLTSVPEAAIDLVRFSFVLNWIVNVNDFFASLGPALNPSFKSLGSCYTINEVLTSTWQPTGQVSNSSSYAVSKQCSGVVTSTTQTKQRVVGINPPKLVVRAKPLAFLSDLRLLDAVALLNQQMRGRNVQKLAGSSRWAKATGSSAQF